MPHAALCGLATGASVRCRKQTISISLRIKLTSVIAMYDTVQTRCPTSDTLQR